MKLRKTLFALILLALVSPAKAQLTSVQFINNSGDAALFGINIYVDGTLVIPGLLYRNSTGFFDVKAGSPVTISVSDQFGTILDTFFSTTTTFSTNPVIKYICVANGIKKTSTGYNPMKPFSLSIFNLGRDVSLLIGNTDVIIAHGCTDAPGPYDFRTGVKNLGDNLVYGQFSSDYTEMPTGSYKIRMTNPSGSKTLKTFVTDFGNHLEFTNKPAVIIMSGFMNPANNNNGPKFGLWAASTSPGPLVELDTTILQDAIARLQLAHNSADTGLDSIDVYINNQLRYDNFAFRTATPFIDLIAKVNTNIGIAKKNSTSVADTFYNFSATYDSARTYLAVANGVRNADYYPYSSTTKFKFTFFGNAKEETGAGSTAVLAMNGSIDVPSLKISEGTNIFAKTLFYPNIEPYTLFTTSDKVFVIDSSQSLSNDTIERYDAQMQTLGFDGLAVTLIASGFYDTAKNKLAPLFGLYWILPSGGQFIRLPINTTGIENIPYVRNLFSMYPNPTTDVIKIKGDFRFEKASAKIYDVTGKLIMSVPAISNQQIDVRQLNAGVYFLSIETGTAYGYQKFIKE